MSCKANFEAVKAETKVRHEQIKKDRDAELAASRERLAKAQARLNELKK
ncbi:MAG: hypothetical protein J5983_04980 [Ruminococcus sp.]|nr:hypothetical protein [Ruminococcus sp.]